MTEEWKAFPENDAIEVSNFGNVRYSYNKVEPDISTQSGYKKIFIGKNVFVHRLVAKTFIENHSGLPAVNHIDGNKLNNRVENLEWISIGDNIRHYFRDIRTLNKPKRIKKKSDYNPRARRIYLTLPPVS